jgi:hypothetical protein
MTEPKVFIYEVGGALDNGQEILVQIFRHEDTHKVIRAQIAFRTLAGDSWGVPTELSFAQMSYLTIKILAWVICGLASFVLLWGASEPSQACLRSLRPRCMPRSH